MKTKQAQDLRVGDDVVLVIDGVRCDVTIDKIVRFDVDDNGIPHIRSQLEFTHHTRGMTNAHRETTSLGRVHSVEVLRSRS